MKQLNAATRLIAGEAQDKADVKRFCKLNHINLNGEHNIPTISKGHDAHLVETFDNWAQAKAFLMKQYRDYQDSGKKPAWLTASVTAAPSSPIAEDALRIMKTIGAKGTAVDTYDGHKRVLRIVTSGPNAYKVEQNIANHSEYKYKFVGKPHVKAEGKSTVITFELHESQHNYDELYDE